MLGSALVYSALAVAGIGLVAVLRPVPRVGLNTRVRGLAVAGGALAVAVGGLGLPTF